MRKFLFFVTLLTLLLGHVSVEAAFNSGSTGADGAFNPPANTAIQVPANGILNYTTVNIPTGVTVTFIMNTANTPVYLLATGDVTISGTISINGVSGNQIYPGKGGPGGFDGGLGGTLNVDGGKGLGPGGGYPGRSNSGSTYGGSAGGGGYGSSGGGSNNDSSALGGSTYGNTNISPVIGGSGGGGGGGRGSSGGGGGGGGGAIVIASSGAITVSGSITANGGNGAGTTAAGGWSSGGGGGGGSGGAIKLMADRISGEGTISASGGGGGATSGVSIIGGAGGSGRIRFEANTVSRSAGTTPAYSYSYPTTVFVANIPTLSITSVGGAAVPSAPSGLYGSPDVTLPSTTTNPVSITVTASNIPVGTTVTISSVPEYGSPASATGFLSGTTASSSTTAQLTLSTQYPCILTATATFTIQTAMYYQGEKIEKVAVASAIGKGTEVTYITETGKRVKAEELIAMGSRL